MRLDNIPFAAAWARSLAIIMNALGAASRFRNPYAYGPTPRRARRSVGRSRWEGHRIRKAKRLEPVLAKGARG